MNQRATPRMAMIWFLAIVWVLIAGTPFVFMMMTGFKEQFELLTNPVWALPQAPTFENFLTVVSGKFFIFLFNSVLVVAVSVMLIVIISAMASYVFARIKFRFSNVLFALIVAGLVIPIHVTLIPVYLLTISIGLYDQIWALVGPYVAFNIPISIFILTEFMRQIPGELEDAARIDGCGPMRVFFQIFLPLSRPGLAAIAIFSAVALWNEFVFAFVM